MDTWLIWMVSGLVLMVLELVVPGGIIVFLGMAAAVVGGAIYFELITSVVHAFISWFIISLIFMVVLRSVFIKFFEGDSIVESTDEDEEVKGKIVEVVESIYPHKEGRVKYSDSTWYARSDDEILKGEKAIIVARDGSKWIVKSI